MADAVPTNGEESVQRHQVCALAMRHFLQDYHQASIRGYDAAKAGWAQTGHQKYKGEMAYWRDVQRAIKWLLAHTDSWCRKHVTQGYGNVAPVSSEPQP